jgi:hypothetical protein
LEKVNQLESKLHSELDHLRGKIQKLEDDTKRVSNIDAVKRDAEVMKKVSRSTSNIMGVNKLTYFVEILEKCN